MVCKISNFLHMQDDWPPTGWGMTKHPKQHDMCQCEMEPEVGLQLHQIIISAKVISLLLMMVVVRILKTIISDSRRLKAMFEKYNYRLEMFNTCTLLALTPRRSGCVNIKCVWTRTVVLFVCLVPPGSTCLQQRSEKCEATREASGAQQLLLCVKSPSSCPARPPSRF